MNIAVEYVCFFYVYTFNRYLIDASHFDTVGDRNTILLRTAYMYYLYKKVLFWNKYKKIWHSAVKPWCAIPCQISR